MRIQLDITITDEEFAAGWKGDANELAASIEATLHELVGDDGAAYTPAVRIHKGPGWHLPESAL